MNAPIKRQVIIDTVLEYFDVDEAELLTREARPVWARRTIWYLLREKSKLPYHRLAAVELGHTFDHSTVVQGLRQFRQRMEADDEFAKQVRELSDIVESKR